MFYPNIGRYVLYHFLQKNRMVQKLDPTNWEHRHYVVYRNLCCWVLWKLSNLTVLHFVLLVRWIVAIAFLSGPTLPNANPSHTWNVSECEYISHFKKVLVSSPTNSSKEINDTLYLLLKSAPTGTTPIRLGSLKELALSLPYKLSNTKIMLGNEGPLAPFLYRTSSPQDG